MNGVQDHEGKVITEIPMSTDAELDELKVMVMQHWDTPGAGVQLSMSRIAAILNRIDAEVEFNVGLKAKRN